MQSLARSWNIPKDKRQLECCLTMLLAHKTVSSMKPGITPDLVIGTCVLIAIAFVVFWLFDKDG
jgi:hypothetical protein